MRILIDSLCNHSKIDYNIDMEENKPQEQLKKFNFFAT
jgi:predicted ABC-type exoprotein transport system permease subunit